MKMSKAYGIYCHEINFDLTAYFLTEDADIKKPCGFRYMGKLYSYNDDFRKILIDLNVRFSAYSSDFIEKTIPFKIWSEYINK